MSKFDPDTYPDLLPLYYKRLFPIGPYFRWLNYGGVQKNYFSHREFSFTLKDDVYIRYLSFSDQQELEKELHKKNPYKIDIGAIYTHRPKDHKTVKASAFVAEEKELVFDIDMTDYDDVRYCCSGADICMNCWPLMTMAIKIIDRALREDFGFDHLLWIYSGRRGVHCWVCDEGARKLSGPGRSAIAEYLTLVKGGDSMARKVNLPERLHPSVRSSINVINQHFQDYAIRKQDLLENEEKWKNVISIVPSDTVKNYLLDDFSSKGKNSSSRWQILKRRLEEGEKLKMIKTHVEDEIKLQFCYPRLDVNVSKGVNHLLKSPFCVHPKTGKVCVPIDPKKADTFDPLNVPTISGLLNELDNVEAETDETGKKVRDYKKTSLGPYMAIFENFLKGLEGSRKGKMIEKSDIKMEF